MEHKSSAELLKSTHNTARFFVEHPQVSWTALIALFVWGLYSYTHMPQRKDPIIAVRAAVATCNWPGATAMQVEQLVTKPMEDTIAQNKFLHSSTVTLADYGIRSASYPGRAVVWIQLADGLKDTREQFSDINLRLNQLQSRLPQGAGPITLQSDFGDTAALMLTVASPTADSAEIAVRANEIQQAIVQVRTEAKHHVPQRVSVAFVYPMAMSAMSLRQVVEQFLTTAQSAGWLSDGRIYQGNGFIGVDGASDWSDAKISAFLDDLIANRLPASSIDPDVWPPVLIRDPSQVREKLTEVAGPKYTYAQLNNITDLLSRSFQGISETARVDRTGILPQQIQLEYSQERLGAYGLDTTRLGSILAARNVTAGGGPFESGAQNVLLNATGAYKDARSISDTIVSRTNTNAPVYLRDLVKISDGYQNPAPLLNYYSVLDSSGHSHRYRAATLSLFMRDGEQIQQYGKAIDQKLADARAWLPSDLILARTSDQPLQVRQNIDLFMDALYEAIILVVIVALIGFWDWRSSLLMSLSIPITLAMTFGLAHLAGIDLQQVSIASLIIALGLLVDDPVVANDAIKREIALGLGSGPAAWIGPTKLATAIIYATATNIIAYLPFLMLTGGTGDFLYSLPVVMTAALVSSRVVSMTFIPLLGRYLLRPSTKTELTLAEKRTRGFYGFYSRTVEQCIRNRWKFLAGACALMALGVFASRTLPTQFFPDDVQYWCYVDVWLPEGTPIARTNEAAEQTESIINRVVKDYEKTHHVHPDKDGSGEGTHLLQSLVSFVGGGGPRFWYSISPQPQQANYAQIIVRVSDKSVTPELQEPLQLALTRELPGVQVVMNQLQTNTVEFPIEIRIASTADVDPANEPADIHAMLYYAEKSSNILRNAPGVAMTQTDWLNEAPQMKLAIDPDRANLAGLGNADIARTAQAAASGVQVGTLRSGDKQIPIVARVEPDERSTLTDVQNLYVPSPNSKGKIPLSSVSRLETDMSIQRIRRQEHFRTVGVHAWPLHGVLTSQILKKVQPQLDELQRELPPGYRMIMGGESAKQKYGFSNLSVVLLISVAGIYAALLIQFKNAIKPLLVFAAVPFGVTGALIGLFITHTAFGFMAFLGVASLIGVIVSHIIVLFDFIEEMHEAGEPLEQALGDAGIERLRPVMITVAATIFALFPLAIHGGPLWKPLCYAQIGGLGVATFVTLLLVPVLYSIAVLDLKIIRWNQKSKSEVID
jgi:multidrug efflux pump subunit AcrB